MYTKRAIEEVLKKAERQTKVILLTGARQVGKTTVIQHVFPEYEYITMDDENELFIAKNDRPLFFQDRSFPMIIDEVQYAPELFRTIKQKVDARTEKGLVFLTGSQRYELMSEAAESLAGRITIVEMSGLSMRELKGDPEKEPFIPTKDYLKRRAANTPKMNDARVTEEMDKDSDLWEIIHRGSMPEMQDDERDWEWFYRDYVRTYIERDIRKIVNIKDELKFRSFLISLAARSAQVIVYSDIASDAGVDIKTVQNWLSVVADSGLVRMIRPYQSNIIKRSIKSQKLFFMDTGLLCYLSGWNTVQSAKRGAMAGHIFETFVVSEIIKSHINAGKNPGNIYYYRDKEKNEIDLVIENGNIVHPVEIKSGAKIDKNWIKSFRFLEKVKDKELGEGAVICRTEKLMPIDPDNMAVPVQLI